MKQRVLGLLNNANPNVQNTKGGSRRLPLPPFRTSLSASLPVVINASPAHP